MNTPKVFVVISLTIALNAGAAEKSSDTAVGSSLPPEVRALLIQEMAAVLDATETILGALVRGEDLLVEEKARAIHDSFIMEQEMTEANRKALVSTVPDAFLERDKAFHELSARLAEAAREGDKPRQQKLFNDMIDACTGCHSRHATDRFPGFAEKP